MIPLTCGKLLRDECVYEFRRTNLFPALRQKFGFNPSGTHMASECNTPGQNHLPEEEYVIRLETKPTLVSLHMRRCPNANTPLLIVRSLDKIKEDVQ